MEKNEKKYMEKTEKVTFESVQQEMLDTYKRKNADYGNSFDESLDEFGIIASTVRMSDKMQRLKTLTKPNVTQQVKDESIVDTLQDLANYAIMTAVWLRNQKNR